MHREYHGMKGTPLYVAWQSMKNRCRYPNRPEFKNYGGRGIMVCDRWKNSFIAFMDDMGSSYQPGLTIDRKDNDLGYSPENCHWIPRSEQSKNRRKAPIWQFKSMGIATNTSGLRGVSFDKQRNKWIAMICVNRKQRNLGRFDNKQDAHDAYLRAASQLRG